MAQLAPPGAGLPLPELLIARIRFRLKCRRTSDHEALNEFTQNQSAILAACEPFAPEQASRQVLIKRIRGLEDSSRNWSIYMTLEHLRIVNDAVASTCELLAQGTTPPGKVSTADVKPRPETGQAVIQSFGESCRTLIEKVSAIESLKTESKYDHPWFGPLDASQWLVLAAFHMRLHKNQIDRIAESLG